MTLVGVLGILALCAVHLLGERWRFMRATPRSAWLSAAGGVSVAYVFMHLLPELARGEGILREAGRRGFEALEGVVYLVALLGLVAYYGLEHLVRERDRRLHRPEHAAGIFWTHMGAFVAYNFVIGHLLGGEEEGERLAFTLFAVALGMHVMVIDAGLQHDHRRLYSRLGRWLLSAALLGGWLVGILAPLPPAAMAVFTALLGGGILFNVLKEELPGERESGFGAFLLGAVVYAMAVALA
jgi:hypothetical protein